MELREVPSSAAPASAASPAQPLDHYLAESFFSDWPPLASQPAELPAPPSPEHPAEFQPVRAPEVWATGGLEATRGRRGQLVEATCPDRLYVLFGSPLAPLGQSLPPAGLAELLPELPGAWRWVDPGCLLFVARSPFPEGSRTLRVAGHSFQVQVTGSQATVQRL